MAAPEAARAPAEPPPSPLCVFGRDEQCTPTPCPESLPRIFTPNLYPESDSGALRVRPCLRPLVARPSRLRPLIVGQPPRPARDSLSELPSFCPMVARLPRPARDFLSEFLHRGWLVRL